MMLQVRLDDRQIKGAFAQCLQNMDGPNRAYGYGWLMAEAVLV